MNKTKIEWVKNPDGTQGYTWNPITGCLNGCAYCYARKLANGRLKSRYLANNNGAPQDDILDYGRDMKDPFYPRFWESRLNDPGLENRKPRGIFAVDMGELFAPWIPQVWTKDVIEATKAYYWHRFYLLTNQPQELPKWSPFPDNCWVGVTATNAKMARNALHELLRIEAKVKYISFEPLLERIYIDCAVGIDWVIIGAQTKPYKPPKMKWIDEIVAACDKAGVPVFLKDNLVPLFEREGVTSREDWTGIRQEMPDGQ